MGVLMHQHYLCLGIEQPVESEYMDMSKLQQVTWSSEEEAGEDADQPQQEIQDSSMDSEAGDDLKNPEMSV
mgnify:CR=1 FL=1